MSRADRLLQSLKAEFPLREIRVELADRIFRLTTALDLDSLIDDLSSDAFNVDERLPYWAELWHSAVALAGMLMEAESDVDSDSALEIGCGLGLPGIIMALRGARVTFSDFDAIALQAAELNVLTNVPDASTEFLELDFRHPPLRQWPLILAADVIYERRFVEPLANFLDSTLTEDGRILLAEPNRLIAIPFFEALEARKFRYTRLSRFANLHGRLSEVSIYDIQRTSRPPSHC